MFTKKREAEEDTLYFRSILGDIFCKHSADFFWRNLHRPTMIAIDAGGVPDGELGEPVTVYSVKLPIINQVSGNGFLYVDIFVSDSELSSGNHLQKYEALSKAVIAPSPQTDLLLSPISKLPFWRRCVGSALEKCRTLTFSFSEHTSNDRKSVAACTKTSQSGLG